VTILQNNTMVYLLVEPMLASQMALACALYMVWLECFQRNWIVVAAWKILGYVIEQGFVYEALLCRLVILLRPQCYLWNICFLCC